ncbi:thiamine pyrophosphate-binding protein [Paenibacillus agricola]|uniref:Thiamine pyrophosphate-binding protein n=1 Tax=Paenibacillus agricola TaxID=2716264 RepID=A0ABX0J7S7_9BACL|nr:thiamine pyrophosphate-binding protein [Paenibacillus agricola]NHN32482.1 thiamine pyrophosphate-binding protein [Paenibacillus agricola]
METVSKILSYHLNKWGVTHVFGIPGKPITPLILELDQLGITFVLSKHECGAGFEAAGYAIASRGLGVALVTAGPGGTNMLTAAGQALATQSPVLFLTGQPPIKEIGKVLGQDSTMFGTDLVKMFEQVTKFSARVERGDLFEVYLKHAIERAFTGVRGPVHLSIPLDVLVEGIQPFELELPLQYPQVISTNIDKVAQLMLEAKRPVLFVGGGIHAHDAYEELEQVATRLNMPVMTTPSGKGVFTSRHPLSLGPFGLGGSQASEDYIREGVDVMIVIGSQLSDLEVPGLSPALYPKLIIHFDYESTFIGKTLSVPTIPVLGNLKRNLQAIIHHTRTATVERSLPIMAEECLTAHASGYLSAELVMRIMRNELPGDAVVFGDAGSHSFYAIKYFDIEEPGTFFFEEVFASMGRAIGYAVGAKMAAPEKTVVCLTGDGCMFMTGTEVSTAVNYGAPVIFVVLNNASLDMVEKGMARHLGRAVGTNYHVPMQAAKFGEAMGAAGFRCTTEEELRAALVQALTNKQVNVIEVMVDPQEVPPTMKRG